VYLEIPKGRLVTQGAAGEVLLSALGVSFPGRIWCSRPGACRGRACVPGTGRAGRRRSPSLRRRLFPGRSIFRIWKAPPLGLGCPRPGSLRGVRASSEPGSSLPGSGLVRALSPSPSGSRPGLSQSRMPVNPFRPCAVGGWMDRLRGFFPALAGPAFSPGLFFCCRSLLSLRYCSSTTQVNSETSTFFLFSTASAARP
jgi:hypothetical protein